MTTPLDLLDFREAVEASWGPDTAYLGAADPARPTLGQCYPTARVLQLLDPRWEIAEGVVVAGGMREKHFWNVLTTGAEPVHLDLTWQQFPPGSRVVEWRVRERESLGDAPATVQRVEMLLARVRGVLPNRA